MNFHAQAVGMVGPRPKGDPDLMLENAGRLVALVAELESQATAVGGGKVSGSGNVVSLANQGTTADTGKLRSAASALEAAESSLRSAALTLRDVQKAWADRVKLQEGRLEHEFTRAKSMGGT